MGIARSLRALDQEKRVFFRHVLRESSIRMTKAGCAL
jgi:hypothetical protein